MKKIFILGFVIYLIAAGASYAVFSQKQATKENSLDFTCHRNRHGRGRNNCFQQYIFPGVEPDNRHRCIRSFSRDCNRFSQYRFFCRLIQQQTAGCQNRNIESTHIFSTAECVCFKNAASTYSENCILTGYCVPDPLSQNGIIMVDQVPHF